MYINLGIFLKALRTAILQRPFRLRRWVFILLFTLLFWLMWILVAVARVLDHIFFPGFRKQEVRTPTFIIAPPRSGTTLLQNLLSLDEERFCCFRLYQTIFPSVLLVRLVMVLGRIDRRLGRVFSRLTKWVERRFFGGWDNLHKLRFNAPEEDGGLFMYTLVTESLYLLFPYVDEIPEPGFPDRLPRRDRQRLMRYYRSCLKRHLYATDPGKTLLLKNTQMCGGIRSLVEEFPDCRIITLIRSPFESVPSHVSVFYKAWRQHSPEITKDSPEAAAYGRLAVYWYEHLHGFLETLPPERYLCLSYEAFVRDQVGTVERIYDHFGLVMGQAGQGRLEAATKKSRQFKSSHEYSVEEYGLTRAWIRERLGPLFTRYGLRACLDKEPQLQNPENTIVRQPISDVRLGA